MEKKDRNRRGAQRPGQDGVQQPMLTLHTVLAFVCAGLSLALIFCGVSLYRKNRRTDKK